MICSNDLILVLIYRTILKVCVLYFSGMSGLVRTGYSKLEIKDNVMEEGP
jgi:hypothetical protein